MNSPKRAITVEGPQAQTVICRVNETLLDTWRREGIAAKFSCRGGSCHTCMLRCVSGQLPERAQHGVPEHLRQKGYFLPCLCIATEPLEIAPVRPDDFITDCILESGERTPEGWLLRLEPVTRYAAEPGQYTCLRIGSDTATDIEAGWITPWRVSNRQEEDFYLHLLLALPTGEAPAAALSALQPGMTVQLRPARPDALCIAPAVAPTPTDADLWAALDHGRKVREVLEDFYTRVFDDALLAPFFRGVTKERLTGKQYSFLHDEMTGSHAYFGDNMRNTHHWMVISNQVFDHRQRLMEKVLREHGLTESQVAGWMHFEERHRSDIVKDTARARQFGGQALPLDGYQEEVMSCGSVCDHCGQIVEPGETVLYHLRLGHISCGRCRSQELRG